MSVIKKQLQKFYRDQGLTGKHLRSALRWDMKAAKANAEAFAEFLGYRLQYQGIGDAFEWCTTPQGFEYWNDRCVSIKGMDGRFL